MLKNTMPLTTAKPMMKTKDIMKHLGLSRETTLQMLRSGTIPSIRFGKSGEFRVDAKVYEEWYRVHYGKTIW